MPNVKFHRVPSPHPIHKTPPDHDSTRIEQIKNYYKKQEHHNEFWKKMGNKQSDWKSGKRICSDHGTKIITKVKEIVKKSKRIKLPLVLEVPDGGGVKRLKNGTRTTAKERKVLKDWTNHENKLAARFGDDAAKELIK